MTIGSNELTEPAVHDVRHQSEGVEIDLSIPENLFYLRGHFPGEPVLPGVVQIDWAVQLADRYLDTGLGGARNFKVKFRSVITPGSDLTIALKKPAGNGRLSFEYRQGTNILSSGSIDLEKDR